MPLIYYHLFVIERLICKKFLSNSYAKMINFTIICQNFFTLKQGLILTKFLIFFLIIVSHKRIKFSNNIDKKNEI